MSIKYFVTGTDTGIGKTYISTGLLTAFTQLNYSTLGIKPIASGAVNMNDRLVSEDAMQLMAASSIKLDYESINPYLYIPPVSPDIAAQLNNESLTLDNIIEKLKLAINFPADIHIIEGVGGCAVPINSQQTLIDLASYYNLHIILVVGMRLGCINHSILSYQLLKQRNVHIAGWVANCFEQNDLDYAAVIASIKNWLDIPFLGLVPFKANTQDFINIELLQS